MKTIEELDVFLLAHDLARRIYRLTDSFPPAERFGLTSQMRRAAASIPTNLMEGAYRIGANELRRFVSIARGSCGELRYQLSLARDLGYLSEQDQTPLRSDCDRISQMLMKLYLSLRDNVAGSGVPHTTHDGQPTTRDARRATHDG